MFFIFLLSSVFLRERFSREKIVPTFFEQVGVFCWSSRFVPFSELSVQLQILCIHLSCALYSNQGLSNQ